MERILFRERYKLLERRGVHRSRTRSSFSLSNYSVYASEPIVYPATTSRISPRLLDHRPREPGLITFVIDTRIIYEYCTRK